MMLIPSSLTTSLCLSVSLSLSLSLSPSLFLSLSLSLHTCTLTPHQVNWGTMIHTNMSLATLQSSISFPNRIEILRREYLNFTKSWLEKQMQK